MLLCGTLVANAQQKKGTITVIDDRNKPVQYAHVSYDGFDVDKTNMFAVTDVNGKAENPIEVRSLITVSFVGFETITDTINPGESRKFTLQESALEIDDVVVTGQYAPTSTRKSVYKIKVLDAKQIENRAAFNLSQLLQNQLKVRLTQDNATGATGIQLQGIGGENVKILVDGVPIIGRLDGQLDLSQINLNNVERVEVIEGPMSVNYGTNALGGVINIITKNPEEGKIGVNQNSYYESVGVFNFDGGIDLSGGKHSASLTGGRNFFDGFTTVEDAFRDQEWNLKEQIFGGLKYKYRVNKNNTIGYSGNLFTETIKDKNEPNANNRAFDSHFTTNRLVNNINFSSRLKDDEKLDLIFSHSYYQRRKNSYIINLENLEQIDNPDQSSHDTSEFTTWLFRGTFSKTKLTKNIGFQAGYDINLESGKGQRISGQEKEINDFAVFATALFKPGARWAIQPGLRIAYNTQYDAPLIPSLNVKYNITEDFTVRASYARGFRAPSLKELYLDFVDVNHNVQGNDSLKAERSHNVNVSALWYTKTKRTYFSIEPSVFYNKIQDRISLVFVGPDAIDFANANIGQYETFGGAVNFNYQFHPAFDISVGYAHTAYSNVSEEDSPDLDKYSSTPEVNTTITYNWLKQKFKVSLFYKYVGETPRASVSNGEIVQQVTEDYHTMDLTLSKLFWKDRINLSLGAKNIFDITQINTTNATGGTHSGGANQLVAWGRTYFIGLKFKIDKGL